MTQTAASEAASGAFTPESLPPFQRAWLGPRYWGQWLALFIYWSLSKLPWRLRRALGRGVGALTYRFSEKRRRFAHINLAWCFPDLSAEQRETIARRFFRVFGCVALDYGVLWWGGERRVERMIRMHGYEHIERLREQGRNVILMTGHSVALDFGAAAATMRYRVTGPMKEVRNPLANWLVARGRLRFARRHGGTLFSRRVGVRAWIKRVRDGELMYYLPDEDLGGTQKTVFAPFFGVSTATLVALGRIAKLADAAVVPMMAFYDERDGTYHVQVWPALDGLPSGDELQDATAQNQALENMIRTHPAQYMWSLRLFQTRPAGEKSPYG